MRFLQEQFLFVRLKSRKYFYQWLVLFLAIFILFLLLFLFYFLGAFS